MPLGDGRVLQLSDLSDEVGRRGQHRAVPAIGEEMRGQMLDALRICDKVRLPASESGEDFGHSGSHVGVAWT
jgi:hypothetical protein